MVSKRMKQASLGFIGLCLIFVLTIAGSSGMEMPERYDLRDVDGHRYVTAVKAQNVPDAWWNNVGLCWAFASLTSFESSLLKQGIVADAYGQEANLSPWHLGCYVGHNHPNYEFNHTMLGNPPQPVSYALDATLTLGWGGSPLFAIDYLSSGRGVVLEKQAPLPLAAMKARETLRPPDEDLPMHYMLRMGAVYERENYISDEEYREAIKAALMEYGAVAAFMHLGAADMPGQAGHGFWRDENFTEYYCDDEELVNQLGHMVAIIGWDNGRSITGAPRPGAWLVKDSMVLDHQDPGYRWISYDDIAFLKGLSYAAALVADDGTGYDRFRYQSRFGTLSWPVSIGSMYESEGYNAQGLDSWGCARFRAERNGVLKAVGLITVNSGERAAISIYQGWDECGQQPIGLLLSDEVEIREAGYHVIDLSEEIAVQFGEEFIIAIGFAARSGVKEPLAYVVNPEQPLEVVKTYLTSFTVDEGWQPWIDFGHIRQDAGFFVQAIFSADMK